MNREQKERCLDAMTVYLKKRRAGYSITAQRLLMLACRKDAESLSERDVLELSVALPAYAQKQELLLDMPFGDETGLPQFVPFSVYHKKKGTRCPFCGSFDTAPVLVGMPADFEETEREEKAHRLYVGGCCLPGPERYCFHCKTEFGSTVCPDSVASVTFRLCRGNGRALCVKITNGNVFCLAEGPFGARTEVSEKKWKSLVDGLFSRLDVAQWRPEPAGFMVMDGMQWHLTVVFAGGAAIETAGDSDTPSFRTEALLRLFRPYLKAVNDGLLETYRP